MSITRLRKIPCLNYLWDKLSHDKPSKEVKFFSTLKAAEMKTEVWGLDKVIPLPSHGY